MSQDITLGIKGGIAGGIKGGHVHAAPAAEKPAEKPAAAEPAKAVKKAVKKAVAIIAMLALPAIALAQPEVLPPLVCSGVTTSTVSVTATSQTLSAYIDAIEIAVSPASAVCVASVATSGGGLSARTIYSVTNATGSVTIRPVATCSTNGTAVAWQGKEFLASEALIVSASTITSTNASCSVTVKTVIDRQR